MLEKLKNFFKLPSVKITGIGSIVTIGTIVFRGCGGCSPAPEPSPAPSASPTAPTAPIGPGWQVACKSTEHLDVCIQFTDSDHQWFIGKSNRVEIGSEEKPISILFNGVQKGQSPFDEALVVGLASSEGDLSLIKQRELAMDRSNVLNNAYQEFMPAVNLYRGSLGQRQSKSEFPKFERSVLVLQFKRLKDFPESELGSKLAQAMNLICAERDHKPIDPSKYSDYNSFSVLKSVPVNK